MDGSDAGRKWSRAETAVFAAQTLSGERWETPEEGDEEGGQAPTFDLDFVALDMGLHFVEVQQAAGQAASQEQLVCSEPP